MRKLLKKSIALTAAFALTLSLAPAASAEPTPAPNTTVGETPSGTGVFEGTVNKDVYSVTVDAISTLDFTVDPEGLLSMAKPSDYTLGKGAVYFKNAGTPATYTSVASAPVDGDDYVKKGATYEAYNADTVYTTTYDDYTVAKFSTLYTFDGESTYTPAESGTAIIADTHYVEDKDSSPATYTKVTADIIANMDKPSNGYADLYADFVPGAFSAHYTKSGGSADTYSGKSDTLTVKNLSSYNVDVNCEVDITMANDAGITLTDKASLTAATDPSLYVGITVTQDTPTTAPIKTAKYTDKVATLDKVGEYVPASDDPVTTEKPGYKVVASVATSEQITAGVASPNGYVYTYQLSDATAVAEAADTVEVNLEAACDDASVADWDNVNDTDLELKLTWNIGKEVTNSITAAEGTLTYDVYTGSGDVTIASYTGFAAEDITVKNGETTLTAEQVTVADGTVKLLEAYVKTLSAGDATFTVASGGTNVSKVVTISDSTPAATATPVLDLSPTMTNRTLTYSKTNGGTLSIDPGSGELAATDVTSVKIGSAMGNTPNAFPGTATYDPETETLTLSAGAWTAATTGSTKYLTVVMNDERATEFPITVTIAD